jgi:hypothetical protein
MMTSGDDNPAENSAQDVLSVLAAIYRCRKELSWILGSNPTIAGTTHDCYVQQSNNFMTEQPEYLFEVFVEATTHSDEPFCWTVSVWRTSKGWEVDRVVSTPEADVRRFEDVSFKTLDELVANYSALLDEFVESARTFDFGHPQGNVTDDKLA